MFKNIWTKRGVAIKRMKTVTVSVNAHLFRRQLLGSNYTQPRRQRQR